MASVLSFALLWLVIGASGTAAVIVLRDLARDAAGDLGPVWGCVALLLLLAFGALLGPLPWLAVGRELWLAVKDPR